MSLVCSVNCLCLEVFSSFVFHITQIPKKTQLALNKHSLKEICDRIREIFYILKKVLLCIVINTGFEFGICTLLLSNQK